MRPPHPPLRLWKPHSLRISPPPRNPGPLNEAERLIVRRILDRAGYRSPKSE